MFSFSSRASTFVTIMQLNNMHKISHRILSILFIQLIRYTAVTLHKNTIHTRYALFHLHLFGASRGGRLDVVLYCFPILNQWRFIVVAIAANLYNGISFRSNWWFLLSMLLAYIVSSRLFYNTFSFLPLEAG